MKNRNHSEGETGLMCGGSQAAYHCSNKERHAAGRDLILTERPDGMRTARFGPPRHWPNCSECGKPLGCPACVPEPICRYCFERLPNSFASDVRRLADGKAMLGLPAKAQLESERNRQVDELGKGGS